MIANVGDLPYVIIIAVIVLIGGSQLPKIARNVGLAGKEFRNAQTEAEQEAKAKEAALTPAVAAPIPAPPVQAPPVQAPVATAPPVAAPPVQAPAPADPAAISLTPAQLDALLKAREDQVRSEGSNN